MAGTGCIEKNPNLKLVGDIRVQHMDGVNTAAFGLDLREYLMQSRVHIDNLCGFITRLNGPTAFAALCTRE